MNCVIASWTSIILYYWGHSRWSLGWNYYSLPNGSKSPKECQQGPELHKNRELFSDLKPGRNEHDVRMPELPSNSNVSLVSAETSRYLPETGGTGIDRTEKPMVSRRSVDFPRKKPNIPDIPPMLGLRGHLPCGAHGGTACGLVLLQYMVHQI